LHECLTENPLAWNNGTYDILLQLEMEEFLHTAFTTRNSPSLSGNDWKKRADMVLY